MDSEPNFLDIQEQLYPETLILKQILFQNTQSHDFTQYFTELKYNSYKREIDLKPILLKYFIQNSHKFQIAPSQQYNYEILIKQRGYDKFYLLGVFPNDNTYTLGENFLSEQMFYLVIKPQYKEREEEQQEENFINMLESQQYYTKKQIFNLEDSNNQKKQSDEDQIYQKQAEKLEQNHNYQQQQQQQQKQQYQQYQHINKDQQLIPSFKQKLQTKSQNKRRSIQQTLKLVAQWRKLITINKIPSNQACQMVKMSKRSLQDYYNTIKLAQKYGFDFENKMKNGFGQLRNFVKEKHQTKSMPKLQILEKFKNMNIKK